MMIPILARRSMGLHFNDQGKHGNKLHLDPETKLFLYQLVGTWGQLLFPRPWKEFRLWYDDHKAKDIKPFLDGMVTTGWYKRIGERIWTPWFIKFIHSRGYYNIYTNFQQEKALSVSHRDAGVNYGKTAGPDSQLLYESSVDANFLRMQPLNSLKWYDFCFRQVIPGRVIRSMDELGAVLPSVQRDSTILLVNLFDATESVTRNLICNFERLNKQNYIFFGPSEFLYDLARRGHPVIHADQFINNLRAYKSITNQNSNSKEILVEAYAIKRCLESGYSSWVVKSNVFFMEQRLNLDSILSSDNFYAGENSGLFFVRHSSAVQKFWVDEVLHNLPAIIDKISSPDERRNLARFVAKSLEGKGRKMNMEMKSIDETNLAVNIDADNINRIAAAGMKLVYWSAQTSSDLIKKQLKELDLWLIDDELSCKAVICHQS